MNFEKIEVKRGFRFSGVWIFLIGSFIALIPQYYIRSSYKIFFKLFHWFQTYPGDLWYCWDHYLKIGFPFPREYPSGIQMIYRLLFRIKQGIVIKTADGITTIVRPEWLNYDRYMVFICLFLGAFAIGTTYILYHIVKNSHGNTSNLWIFWILTPSYLFYGLLNLDFISIFTIVIAYYLFHEEEYYLSAALLSIGTSIKVFPIFLTPLLFFQCPKKYRWGSVLSFILVWVAFNAPFMIREWSSWVFPYQWQIQSNFATSPKDGSFWWIFYQLLGPHGKMVGRLSLILYAVLYFYFLKSRWDLPLARKCAGIILLFLLTDRIYSPQYNLYLLPFLVMVDYKINRCIFYAIEIPNVIQVMFLFFFKTEPYTLFLQTLIFLKYAALILLFIQNWFEPVVMNTDAVYNEYKKIASNEEK